VGLQEWLRLPGVGEGAPSTVAVASARSTAGQAEDNARRTDASGPSLACGPGDYRGDGAPQPYRNGTGLYAGAEGRGGLHRVPVFP
jgi:hypothetical protein